MIERERPQRPPFVPAWVVPTIVGVLALLVFGVGLVLWLNARSAVTVPSVVGDDEAVARVTLAQAGLAMQVTERPFDASDAGTVLAQSPVPGATLHKGDVVNLTVSAGTEEFALPDVIGLPYKLAEARLKDRGLVVKIDRVESDAPKDTVIATNPSPGATVRTTDYVRMTVASSPDASSALLPYNLQGAVFVIDPGVYPSELASGTVDAPLDVARRLRSLLEASGATVIVTRSLNSTATAPADRAREVTGTVSAIVGLDVDASGAGGIAVTTLSETAAGSTFQAATALADAIAAQVRQEGMTATRGVIAGDPVLLVTLAPGVRVRLGSLSTSSDVASFKDPAWADQVARAIYRGLGERLGSR